MSALIRDEHGSQAVFLAVTAAVRVRVGKKLHEPNGPATPIASGLSGFSLRRIVPRDSVEKLSGKILIHRLNHARVIGRKESTGKKKLNLSDCSCAHGTGLFRVLQNYAP
jgi:hypothetical protein